MINLLPLEEKRKLLSGKKERLTVVLGIVVLVSLFCLALVLLAIKFYLLADVDHQNDILKQFQKENQTQEFVDLNNAIQKYNLAITQLDSFYKKEIYFGQIMDIITNISRPEGVFLADFSLKRSADGNIQISVSGTSDTREHLLVFRKSVEQDNRIKNPYFPPNNWIDPENVSFSLTFNIDKTILNNEGR